jgi:hypothetical protein
MPTAGSNHFNSFIENIVFSYASKGINSKQKNIINSLNLNFFSSIKEIDIIKTSALKLINHSNV